MGKISKFISADGASTYLFTIADNGCYQKSITTNFGNRQRSAIKVAMLSGGFDSYGKSISPNEVGTVQLQGTLRSSTVNGMEAKRETLEAIAGYGLGILYYQETDSAQDVKFCFARCTSISMPQRPDQYSDLHQDFTASFEVPEPVWHTDGTETSIYGEAVYGTDTWGGTPASISASGTSTDDTVTYNGVAPAIARITISCGGSQTCQNPIVRRIVNGQTIDEISYSGTLGNNAELVINPRARSVKLNAVSDLANFDFLHPSWFRLVNGSNTIRVIFDNSGDAATIKVSYYENFYGA